MSAPKYILTFDDLARLTGEPAYALQASLRDQGLGRLGPKSPVPTAAVRGILAGRGADYSFRVIAAANLRGGIGKTTCCVTLASRAKQLGFKTCLLDLDAQGSASLAFDKLPEEDEPVFYDVWQRPGEMVMASLQEIEEGLYLLPSSLENGLLDVSLINPAAQKNAVRGVCQVLEENDFDLVVIDCPPSLGAAVISTICATDVLVVPLWSDTFSFKGMELTLEEIESICDTFNLEPPTVRLLYSRNDKREKLSAQAIERLTTEFKDLFVPSVIGTSTEISKALARKETLFASRRSSPVKTAYDRFIRTVLELDSVLA